MSILNTYPHDLNGEINIITDSLDINGSIYAVGIYNDIYLYLTKFNNTNATDTSFGKNGFTQYDEISSKALSIIFSQTYNTNFTNKNANIKMLYENDKIYVFLTNNDTPVTFIIARFNIDGTLDNTYYGSGYYAHDNTDDLIFVDAISINNSIVLLCQTRLTNGQIHLIYLNSNGNVTNTITVNSSDFNISSFNSDNSGDWNAVSIHFDSDENIYVGINIINSNTANSYGGIFKVSRTFSIDKNFGTNGIFTYSANSINNTLLRDIIVDTTSSYKIYALFTDNTNKEFIIHKLNSDGTSDTSFNSNGIKKITDSNFTPIIYTSTLDHNNNYIISGTYFNFATLEEKLFYYKIKSDGSTESDDLVNSLGFYEYENRTVLDNTKYTEIYSIVLGTSTNGGIYSNGKRYDLVPIIVENLLYSDNDFNPHTTNGDQILRNWTIVSGNESDPYARHSYTLTDETDFPFANGTYQLMASSDIHPSYIHNLHIVLINQTGTFAGLDWVTEAGSYVWNGESSVTNGEIVTTATNGVDYLGSWIQITLPYNLKLHYFNVVRSSHLPYLNPTYMHFLGSNDGGTTFEFIHSIEAEYDGVSIRNNNKKPYRKIPPTKGYSTIRMVVEEIGGNETRANSINIEAWDLEGQVVEYVQDTENKQTVAFMQNSPYERYLKVTSKNETKSRGMNVTEVSKLSVVPENKNDMKEIVKFLVEQNKTSSSSSSSSSSSKLMVFGKDIELVGFTKPFPNKPIYVLDGNNPQSMITDQLVGEQFVVITEENVPVTLPTLLKNVNVRVTDKGINSENVNTFQIEKIQDETIVNTTFQDEGTSYVLEGLTITLGSIIGSLVEPIICFKERTQILTLDLKTGLDTYKNIENINIGDLISTYKHGYVPVNIIGYSNLINTSSNYRITDKLYVYKKEDHQELIDDLYMTGGHSVLLDDDKISDYQCEKMIEEMSKLYKTDDKTRLMAKFDYRCSTVNDSQEYRVWHICLDHENETMNYGIYANGMLVESTCERHAQNFLHKKENVVELIKDHYQLTPLLV